MSFMKLRVLMKHIEVIGNGKVKGMTMGNEWLR